MITIYRPAQGNQLPPLVFQSNLVVQRGLRADELESIIQVELAGVRCVNSPNATQGINDRARMMSLLAAAALPVPKTITAHTWEEVIEFADNRPAAIKRLDGSVGRGLHVLLSADGRLPLRAPFGGPFIVQEYISADDTVRKLYVVGNHTRGLSKSAGNSRTSPGSGVPIDITPRLSDLPRHAGAALGMEIYGVDILDGTNGPIIVDVNPFPGFRDVPDAARLIANHLVGIVTRSIDDPETGPPT